MMECSFIQLNVLHHFRKDLSSDTNHIECQVQVETNSVIVGRSLKLHYSILDAINTDLIVVILIYRM